MQINAVKLYFSKIRNELISSHCKDGLLVDFGSSPGLLDGGIGCGGRIRCVKPFTFVKERYHCATSFNSIQEAFKSQNDLEDFLRSVVFNLDTGGFFAGVTLDGTRLIGKGNPPSWIKFANTSGDRVEPVLNTFEQKVQVTDSEGSTHEENLVFMDPLIHIASQFGLRLVNPPVPFDADLPFSVFVFIQDRTKSYPVFSTTNELFELYKHRTRNEYEFEVRLGTFVTVPNNRFNATVEKELFDKIFVSLSSDPLFKYTSQTTTSVSYGNTRIRKVDDVYMIKYRLRDVDVEMYNDVSLRSSLSLELEDKNLQDLLRKGIAYTSPEFNQSDPTVARVVSEWQGILDKTLSLPPEFTRRRDRHSFSTTDCRIDLTIINGKEYEVEIEYLTLFPTGTLDYIQYYISRVYSSAGVTNHVQLMSAKEYSDVSSQYKKVVSTLIPAPRSDFFANKPVNLKFSDIPAVGATYCITPKLDGIRKLMVVTSDGMYLLGNNMLYEKFISSFELTAALKSVHIFDGEYMFVDSMLQPVFYIFDVLVFDGKDKRSNTIPIRSQYIQTFMDSFKDIASVTNILRWSQFDCPDGQLVTMKDLTERYLNFRSIPTDGVVYTPRNEPYYSNAIFKYKPPANLTIDFYIHDGKVYVQFFEARGSDLIVGKNMRLKLFTGTKTFPFGGKILPVHPFYNDKIVECGWDVTKLTFVPERVRTDKTVPNFIIVAQNVWSDIMSPILPLVLLEELSRLPGPKERGPRKLSKQQELKEPERAEKRGPVEIEDFFPFYPDPSESSFNESIRKKKEFLELSGLDEKTDGPEMKLVDLSADQPEGFEKSIEQEMESVASVSGAKFLKHQKIPQRYVSPYTMYDQLFLIHYMGTGKTPSACSVTEYMRKNSTVYTGAILLFNNEVLINNFKNDLVFKFSGGDFLPESVKRGGEIDRSAKIRINKALRSYYTFYTYHGFAKRIEDRSHAIDPIYSNKIYILDEVHHLRHPDESSEPKGPKPKPKSTVALALAEPTIDVYATVHKFLHTVSNTKIILLSGTPMRDQVSELSPLMNLLLPLDKQLPEKLEIEDIKRFKDTFKGYVSFLSAQTDVRKVFEGEIVSPMKHIKLVVSKMSEYQTKAYLEAQKSEEGLFSKTRQASLFAYPIDNKIHYGDMFRKYFSTGRRVYFKKNIKLSGTTVSEKLDSLKVYSNKYAGVIERILVPDESTFVYSSFVRGSGLLVFAKILEEFGFVRYSPSSYNSSTIANLAKTDKLRYIVLTGDSSSAEIETMKAIFNAPQNAQGKLIKVILGSPVVSEGITFKNVQQVHILNPYWNFAEIDQAISRTIRLFSHQDLKQLGIYKPIKVFLHASIQSTKDTPTLKNIEDFTELYMYHTAETKDVKIRSAERLLKQYAFDCSLNYERNNSSEFADYSRECDYRKCGYKCEGIQNQLQPVPENMIDKSTYDLYYYNREEVLKELRELFKREFSYNFKDIMSSMSTRHRSTIVILKILSECIHNQVVFMDKYGFGSVLQQSTDGNNVFFLSRNTGSSLLSYYTENPTLVVVPEKRTILCRDVYETREEFEEFLKSQTVFVAEMFFEQAYAALKANAKTTNNKVKWTVDFLKPITVKVSALTGISSKDIVSAGIYDKPTTDYLDMRIQTGTDNPRLRYFDSVANVWTDATEEMTIRYDEYILAKFDKVMSHSSDFPKYYIKYSILDDIHRIVTVTKDGSTSGQSLDQMANNKTFKDVTTFLDIPLIKYKDVMRNQIQQRLSELDFVFYALKHSKK